MGKKYQITILDTVHCKANKFAREAILPVLKYDNVVFEDHPDGFGKVQQIKESHLVTGNKNTGGTFLTGLLPRIKKYCEKKDIPLSVVGEEENILPSEKRPDLGIAFRRGQKKAFRRVKKKGRGLIVFPTAYGKTIVALGLFFMFKNCVRLFLCDRTDILRQTIAELKKYKFKNVIQITTQTDWRELQKQKSPILVSTIQTFHKINAENYVDWIDVTVVDEVHHANRVFSMYGEVMTQNLSPVRIGLTATPPTSKKQELTVEGLFGPILAQITTGKAEAEGVVVKPKIHLLPVPYDVNINKLAYGRYNLFYKYGIVENTVRNDLARKICKKRLKEKAIILLIVEKIEHGKRLAEMLKVEFVHGQTPKEKRDKIKQELIDGKRRIAVVSRVWKEGVNIPSLTDIFNMAGMKDEKGVIQAIGRGLRTAKNKDTLHYYDFLDPYRYLAEHAISRMQVYQRENWL